MFRYLKKSRVESDPAKDLIGAIPPPLETYLAAITEPEEAAEMLRPS